MTPLNHIYIECECTDIAHLVRITVDPSDDWSKLRIEVTLNRYRGFWSRLWLAVRYVFGYQSQYGAYSETLVSEGQANKIIDAIKKAYPNL